MALAARVSAFVSVPARRGHACRKCSMRFVRELDLQRHQRMHSSAPHTWTHQCRACAARFPLKVQLAQHLCPCTKEARKLREQRLRARVIKAAPISVYGCASCGKLFKHKWSLTRHTLAHSGNRPHACMHCNRTFTLRWQMTRHVRKAHQDAPAALAPLPPPSLHPLGNGGGIAAPSARTLPLLLDQHLAGGRAVQPQSPLARACGRAAGDRETAATEYQPADVCADPDGDVAVSSLASR